VLGECFQVSESVDVNTTTTTTATTTATIAPNRTAIVESSDSTAGMK
jgi:hypothetical protein